LSNLAPDATAEVCVSEPDARPTLQVLPGRLTDLGFVARTPEEIVAAREDWQAGRRFGEVRTYAGPRLDAPSFLARPVPRP